MKVHELKIHPEHFREITLGLKTYEVRLNDRNFEVGDYILLREYYHEEYQNNEIMVRIKHILADFEGLAENYVVLGLNEVIDRSFG